MYVTKVMVVIRHLTIISIDNAVDSGGILRLGKLSLSVFKV